MPDPTLSQAIKEAYASAGEEPIYHTLEIWHPNFSEPIRVVRDYENLEATLEATAPRNAGQAVTFAAYAFDFVPPGDDPQAVIEIDNVRRDIIAAIESTQGSPEKITAIYRAFLANDLSGPENDPPMELTVLSINAGVFRIRATCGFGDYTNKRFPDTEYSADVFPGLIAQ